jgi:hypothetical protein
MLLFSGEYQNDNDGQNMELLDRVEDVEFCTRCGGRCCKTSPGRFAPTDCVGPDGFDIALVQNLIEDGKASVAVGLVRALGSRLAPVFTLKHRGSKRGALEFFSSDTTCAALREQGCSYALDGRPFECAAIVPSATKCTLPGNLQMEDLWAPHQTMLYTLIAGYAGCEWQQEFDRQLNDKRNKSPFKLNAQKQINTYGITMSVSEISLIADLARSIE